MSLRFWIERLEKVLRERPGLADVPVLLIDGTPVTLREALEMLKRGERVEDIIKGLTLVGLSNDVEKLKKLAIEFFRRMPSTMRVAILTREGTKVLGPEDIVREIELGTEIGRRHLEEYRSYLLTVRALLGI